MLSDMSAFKPYQTKTKLEIVCAVTAAMTSIPVYPLYSNCLVVMSRRWAAELASRDCGLDCLADESPNRRPSALLQSSACTIKRL